MRNLLILSVFFVACTSSEQVSVDSSLTTHTVQVVPVLDAAPGAPVVATFTPALMHIVRLPIVAAQTITAVRAHVQDAPGTRLRFAVATTHDGTLAPVTFTTSTISAGNGTEQDIYDTDFGMPAPAVGQQWFVAFQVASGTGSGNVSRLEIDVAE